MNAHPAASHLGGALRGAAAATAAQAAAGTHRWLTTTTTTTEDEFSNDVSDNTVADLSSDDTNTNINNNNKGMEKNASTIYLILLTVMMGMICMFYAGCLCAIIHTWIHRQWFGGGARDDNDSDDDDNEAGDTVVVHDGRVFNVMGNQRRAVLEAIFKETSKVRILSKLLLLFGRQEDIPSNMCRLTPRFLHFHFVIQLAAEVDVLKKRKKKCKNTVEDDEEDDDVKVPQDVEFPTMIEPSGGADSSSNNNNDLSSPARTRTTTGTSSSSSTGQDGDTESSIGRSDVTLCPSSETHLRMLAVDQDDLTIQSGDFQQADDMAPERSREDEVSTCPDHLHSFDDGIHQQTPTSSFDIGSNEECPRTPVHVNMDRKPAALAPVSSTLDEHDQECEHLPDTLAIPTLADTWTAPALNGLTISEQENAEESKEEIATETNPNERLEDALSHDPGIASRQSITTVASEYTYDDDSTVTSGDIVCPICLCGYKKGDTLVVAKHCTHMYHKDCIFEWLDKRTDCPVCRKDMVTASEKVAMRRATLLETSRTTYSFGYRSGSYR